MTMSRVDSRLWYVMLGTFLFLIVSCSAAAQNQRKSNTRKADPVYTIVTFKEHYKNIYLVEMKYPKFLRADILHKDANERIKQLVNELASSYLSMRSLNHRDLRREHWSGFKYVSELKVHPEIGLVQRNLVSFAIMVYEFAGGAHGTSHRYHFNLVRMGDFAVQVRFADLFLTDPYALYDLREELVRRLRESMERKGYYRSYVQIRDEGMNNFILTRTGIKWVFEPPDYDGSLAEGSYEVSVPYGLLLPIMRQEWQERLKSLTGQRGAQP